jgi:orotate phosphoribosyltransferase
MVVECLSKTETDIDTIVGVALSGIPLANMIAEELGVEFATYHPNKQKLDPELDGAKGTISQNFAKVSGKNCVLIDDVVTSGTTLTEAVSVLLDLGAKPVAIAVLIDKKGIDDIAGVPLNALLRVTRVDKIDTE